MRYRYSFADRERLEATKAYIDAHLHLPLRLDELSRMAFMSRPKLNAGFVRFYGMAVKAYRLRRRMEKAKALLQTTDESIEAVALAVGYQNGSNFSKVYQRFYGHLPKAEREGW